MYRWYQDSQICYAYLCDVPTGDHTSDEHPDFNSSSWFTRGWTLQELLAPNMIVFFDKAWGEIGTKASLSQDIKRITGIDDLYNFRSASVAQKMSWAARRETTRVEDRAYSLMGIFNINMPTLYGEGERAFQRLQHEIIKITEDQSIFAWASDEGRSGLFASSPSSFLKSGNIIQLSGGAINSIRPSPHSMTSRGLMIELDLLDRTPRGPPGPAGVIGLLHCRHQRAEPETCFAVYLTNVRGEAPDVFNRVECSRLLSMRLSRSPIRKTVYIRQEHPNGDMQQSLSISIRTRSIECDIPLSDRHPLHGLYWSDEQKGPKLLQIFASGSSTTVSSLGNVAYLIFRDFEVPFVLVIGIFQDCPPLIDIRRSEKGKSLDDVAQLALREKTFELNKFRSRFVTDRLSLGLGSSGKVLKAAMKKKLVGGKAEYVLELDIVPA
jgi:hypothetical protein